MSGARAASAGSASWRPGLLVERGADPARDLEILARLDHERARRRAGRTDVLGARGVPSRVDRDTEEGEPLRGAGADLRRALAHAAGEHERVEPAERGR